MKKIGSMNSPDFTQHETQKDALAISSNKYGVTDLNFAWGTLKVDGIWPFYNIVLIESVIAENWNNFLFFNQKQMV